MPYRFQLEERLIGFSLNSAEPGEQVKVITRELIGPSSTHLTDRLEELHTAIFSKIMELPRPSAIDHMVVIIYRDLSGVAYVNELVLSATVRLGRDVTAGNPVLSSDISNLESITLSTEVPDDAAVVVVLSLGWKRSLYFDLAPLQPNCNKRHVPLQQALAQQMMLLLGLVSFPNNSFEVSQTQVDYMASGLERLRELLADKCQDEATYQELLESHSWMLGYQYKTVERHTTLDDQQIPDFTAIRASDMGRDVFEIKQPFLKLFKGNGDFTACFNDAWNQGERYLTFVQRQRAYLQDQKGLRFENARCILVIGYNLSATQLQSIKAKESITMAISVVTYNELINSAEHILKLVQVVGQPISREISNYP